MMKKAYKLTFQNGKNRLVEDDAPLEHLRAVCLNRYLSDGSGELSLCKAVEEVLDQQMALRVLDEMDALRRKQWYHLPPPCDYYLRAMEAIVARAAGYASRTDWTDCLKSDAESQYCRDLEGPEKQFVF